MRVLKPDQSSSQVKTIKPNQSALIQALLKPEAYPHPVNNVELIETHISWVFLTGSYAYKLKKAVHMDFVEATTLKQRLHFCEEELRLNQRLAPDLYLGIAQIIGSANQPQVLEANIERVEPSMKGVIEVAVKMRQFSGSHLLSTYLKQGVLQNLSLKDLALELAEFHLSVETAPANSDFGGLDAVINPVHANLRILEQLKLPDSLNIWLEEHRFWVRTLQEQLSVRFKQRLTNGAIRECHGDLHAGNIHLKNNGFLEVFDAIDFNPSLRWIDPISEMAFLTMDIQIRDHQSDAMLVLNEWLEHTGDYKALDLWPWYSAYRALVRAKVSGLQWHQLCSQKQLGSVDQQRLLQLRKDLDLYIARAGQIQLTKPAGIVLMHGLSGSGKSYVSEMLYQLLPAVRIRSDVERQRVCGRRPLQKLLGVEKASIERIGHTPSFKGDPYRAEISGWLFDQCLPSLTQCCLKSGLTTIVDATFLRERERQRMLDMARQEGYSIAIVACECSDSTAEKRITERLKVGADPSEANLNVRELQKAWLEPLTSYEQTLTVRIAETTPIKIVVKQLEDLLNY